MTSAALRSRAWKLLELVTTPLLPSDYLDLVSPLRAGADLRGRIEAVHPETADAATIVIQPGRDFGKPHHREIFNRRQELDAFRDHARSPEPDQPHPGNALP